MPNERILFSKEGTARFLSHLDLMRTMQRAFLRAGISIRHTEGFHPHPYISIPLPLPLGFSSGCELLEFGLEGGATPETLPDCINQVLPSGLTVHRCYQGGQPFRNLASVRYLITLEYEADETPTKAAKALKELLARESLVITKRSKKAKSGQTEVDLIPLIQNLESIRQEGHQLKLQLLARAQNPGLNPSLLLGAFSGEYPQLAPASTGFHRIEVFCEDQTPYR